MNPTTVAFLLGFIVGAPAFGLLLVIVESRAPKRDDVGDAFGAGYQQGYRVGAFEALTEAEREDYRKRAEQWADA